MTLLEQHSLFLGGYCVLLAFPILLLLCHFFIAQPSRRRQLETHRLSQLKAGMVVISETVETNQTLGALLSGKFNETQTIRKYLLPVICFYISYSFTLYWATVAIGEHFKAEQSVHQSEGQRVPESALGHNKEEQPGDGVQHQSEGPAEQTTVRSFGAEGPVSVGQILLLPEGLASAAAVLGSALFFLLHISQRIVTLDLHPRVFVHYSVRILLSPLIAVALSLVVGATGISCSNWYLFLGFAVGMFPTQAYRRFQRRAFDLIGIGKTPVLPLTNIQGIDSHVEIRLWEAGISDAQHLAWESIVSLLVSTSYSIERIIDWKDQALLYVFAQKKLSTFRDLHMGSALCVLGMHPNYYGKDYVDALLGSIATSLGASDAVKDADTQYTQLQDALNKALANPICDQDAAKDYKAILTVTSEMLSTSKVVENRHRYHELLTAVAEKLGEPTAVLDRFVDSLFNDPSVQQLWRIFEAIHHEQGE